MGKILLTIVFLALGQGQAVKASALNGAVCSVKAKVVAVGSELRGTDPGRNNKNYYIDLLVLGISGGRSCPVAKGRRYRAVDNYPGVFRKGDVIRGGVESASSMGPAGAVNFLQWSRLTYENGTPILGKNNAQIDSLQSGDTPIKAGGKKAARGAQ